MPVRQTLDQLNADARQHCNGCAKCDTLKDSWVMCSGVRVGFANGICPLSLWDHSAPQPVVVRKAKSAREPETVDVCFHKFREWPVAVWEQIQKCPLVGSRFKVPREMYERIKDEWIGK